MKNLYAKSGKYLTIVNQFRKMIYLTLALQLFISLTHTITVGGHFTIGYGICRTQTDTKVSRKNPPADNGFVKRRRTGNPQDSLAHPAGEDKAGGGFSICYVSLPC